MRYARTNVTLYKLLYSNCTVVVTTEKLTQPHNRLVSSGHL